MLIQGSFLSSLLNLLPQKGMTKMIDCSKTENYFAEKLRMTKRAKNGLCKLGCSNCPLCSINNNKGQSCTAFEMLYPEKAIETIQRWSDEHPQRTYLSEFLKNYPNAPLEDDGTPNFCPYRLGLMSKDNCRKDHNCVKCWNQPIEGGEK
jgi:hypothetical protein|nr:MAG TPA: hypothetical protein [Caudoviricetes sp.]